MVGTGEMPDPIKCKYCAGPTITLETPGDEMAYGCKSCGRVTIKGTETASWPTR